MQIDLSNTYTEFAIILMAAAVFAAVGRLLKQPLIVAFIALGIVAGPDMLNIIQSTDQIHLLAEIGIAILLFVVGLKLDINLIKTTGKVSVYTGLGQVLFTSGLGFLISLLLGYEAITSLYIAIALTFSSTIIIVKLLSDKKEIDSLHGQIALGFLIVQDLVVVFLMVVLPVLGDSEGNRNLWAEIGLVLLKGAGLLVLVRLIMNFVIPPLLKFLAGSQELLVLFSIAWAVSLSATSEYLGFSKEVGAFIAGVSLASTQFREVISGRLTSIRDFLLLFFFVHLASDLDLSLLGAQVVPALVLSVFVLVGNPIIVLIIMGLLGYKKRTGFLAGLTVAQISEFSLIFASLGLDLGHIDEDTLGLITLVGLITISLSTYMITYSHQLFSWLSPLLNIFEFRSGGEEGHSGPEEGRKADIIIFGIGRFGTNIAWRLQEEGYQVLGVDFDPKAVDRWNKKGQWAQYGDAEDPEITEQIPFNKNTVVISTLDIPEINLSLIKYLRFENQFQGKIIVTTHRDKYEQMLLDAGADLVVFPYPEVSGVIVERLNELGIIQPKVIKGES